MLKRICTAKISGARVTRAVLRYEGSLGIDSDVLRAAGILPYEMVLVANLRNGRRFETYAIAEPAGGGGICLYGGAARMGAAGDEIIIMAHGLLTAAEAARFQGPRVVRLGPRNRVGRK